MRLIIITAIVLTSLVSCTDKYESLSRLNQAPVIRLSADSLYVRCHDTSTLAGQLIIYTADANENLQQIAYTDTSYGKISVYYDRKPASGVIPVIGDSTRTLVVANSPGVYELTFTLKDRLGKTDQQKVILKTIDNDITPVAHLKITAIDHWVVELDGSASADPYGYVARYHFSIDGQDIISNGPIIRQVFYEAGTHSLSLFVENDVNILSASVTQSITIQ